LLQKVAYYALHRTTGRSINLHLHFKTWCTGLYWQTDFCPVCCYGYHCQSV